MKTQHLVKIEVKLTDENIDDIMSAAIESSAGIQYWCDQVKIKPKSHDGEQVHFDFTCQALTRGHSLKIHDQEGEKWHELTLAKLLKGLALEPDFNYDDYDAPAADRIVQLAIFGEVIYG